MSLQLDFTGLRTLTPLPPHHLPRRIASGRAGFLIEKSLLSGVLFFPPSEGCRWRWLLLPVCLLRAASSNEVCWDAFLFFSSFSDWGCTEKDAVCEEGWEMLTRPLSGVERREVCVWEACLVEAFLFSSSSSCFKSRAFLVIRGQEETGREESDVIERHRWRRHRAEGKYRCWSFT